MLSAIEFNVNEQYILNMVSLNRNAFFFFFLEKRMHNRATNMTRKDTQEDH